MMNITTKDKQKPSVIYSSGFYKTLKGLLKRTILFEFLRVTRNKLRSRWLIKKLSYGQPFKLEIGGGPRGAEGYIHLDTRAELPSYCIDIVHDISRPLPFPAETVTEIMTNHCIEHVSWQKLGGILKDFHRVLIPGGRLLLRTPDLESIVRSYLAGTLSVGYPKEEEKPLLDAFGKITQSNIAILKLYALQNYSANFHCAAYDWATLRDLLRFVGFSRVEGPDALPASSENELRVIAWK